MVGKRVLLVFLACVVVLAVVSSAGCGGSGQTSSDPQVQAQAKQLLSELNAGTGTKAILQRWANTKVGSLCIKPLPAFKGGSGYQVDMLELKELAGQ
jgi:hypothetical protein